MDVNGMLAALMSPNNEARRAAEASYNQFLEANPSQMCASLMTCLAPSNEVQLRMMSATLLRQILDANGKHWAKMDPQAQAGVREGLLSNAFASVATDQRVVLNRVAHCIAQTANANTPPFTNLLPTLANAIQQGTPADADLALYIVQQLPEYAPAMVETNSPWFLEVLGSCINNPPMAVAATKALLGALLAIENPANRAPFSPLLNPAFGVLLKSLQSDTEVAVEIINQLIAVAEESVDVLKAQVNQIIDALLGIAVHEDVDVRSQALVFICTLCRVCPARIRRSPRIMDIINLTFQFMAFIEDEDDEWVLGKYDDKSVDEDESFVLGDEAIESLISCLGKSVLNPVLGLVEPNMASPQWPQRRAAVALLGGAIDGASKNMKPYMATVVRYLLAGLADPHPRVKFYAITGIARLADVFPGTFQKQFGLDALAAVNAIVGDANQCVRVRGHAISSLINVLYPKVCEVEWVEAQLEPVLVNLGNILGAPTMPVEVHEEALDAVACIAQVHEDGFAPYYKTFVNGIFGILAQCAPQSAIQGKALQCVGLIGEAVGVDLFMEDAVKVMQMLQPAIQCAGGVIPDGYYEYYAPACARIAKATKDKFETFLPTVIPPLLHTLKQKVQVKCEELSAAGEMGLGGDDDEEEEDDSGMRSQVMEFHGGQKLKISMNISVIQDMTTAAQVMNEYAEALETSMVAYVDACCEALIPLVVFDYNEDVRISACFATAQFFTIAVEAVKKGIAPPEFAQKLLNPVVEMLLRGVAKKQHMDGMMSAAESLRNVLSACFESGGEADAGVMQPATIRLPPIGFQQTTQQVIAAATRGLERRNAKLQECMNNEEMEEEDREMLEEELEEEEGLMTHYIDCIGYMLKTLRGEAIPLFEAEVLPLFGQFMTPDQPPSLRHNAVCLFDDMVEFGGPGVEKYLPALLPILCRELDSDMADLRQASVYGAMQVAKNFPHQFAQVYGTVVPKILAMVAQPDARDEENECVTENCISALGAIATHAAPEAEKVPLLQQWVAQLPLRIDEIEARSAHRMLCDLVEQNHPAVVSNLPKLLAIFAEILHKTERENKLNTPEALVDGRSMDRLVAIVKQMQASTPPDQLQAAYMALPEAHQRAVQAAF